MSAGAVALQFKRCRPTMKRSGALRTHSRDGMLPMLAQRSRAGFGFMMLNRASLPSISSQERGQGGAQAAAGRPRRRHRDPLAEQQKHVGSCALWQPACTQFTNVATVVKTGLWLRKCAGSHVKQSGESGSTAKGALPLCTLSIKNCTCHALGLTLSPGSHLAHQPKTSCNAPWCCRLPRPPSPPPPGRFHAAHAAAQKRVQHTTAAAPGMPPSPAPLPGRFRRAGGST